MKIVVLCEIMANLKIVNSSFKNRNQLLLIIDGGPGTGKSTLVMKILELYYKEHYAIMAFQNKTANMFIGGTTIHDRMKFTIPKDSNKKQINKLKVLSNNDKLIESSRNKELRILIIDEFHQNEANTIDCVNLRLQETRSNKQPFGGVDIVLLVGDPFQLKGMGTSPMEAILDLNSNAGELLRQFKRIEIKDQVRAQYDLIRCANILYFRDITIENPITESWLQRTCTKCSLNGSKTERKPEPNDEHQPGGDKCPVECSHRCQHFKVLLSTDVDRDRLWKDNTQCCSCLNSTCNLFSLEKLKARAIQLQLPVIKFLKPIAMTTKAASSRNEMEILLTEASRGESDDFYTYFVPTVPVRLSYNVNKDLGLVKGSVGHLHSLAWNSTETKDRVQITIGQCKPGQILTLSTDDIPDYINLQFSNDLFPLLCNVTPVMPSNIVQKSLNKETITSDTITIISLAVNPSKSTSSNVSKTSYHRKVKVQDIYIISSGFIIDYACTVFSIQGVTLDRLLANFNYSPNFPSGLLMDGIYMTYTRTKTEQGFRIVDWNEDDPKDLKHLLKMTQVGICPPLSSGFLFQGHFPHHPKTSIFPHNLYNLIN